MRGRSRIAGWALVAAGGAALLVGASPIFPVVGSALLVGGALLAAGLWFLLGRPPGGPARGASRGTGPAAADPVLAMRARQLARERGGVLTAAQAARDLRVTRGQAEAALEACVRAGHALPEFDAALGGMLYRFPDRPGGDQQGAQR